MKRVRKGVYLEKALIEECDKCWRLRMSVPEMNLSPKH